MYKYNYIKYFDVVIMAENIKKFEPKFESISDVNLELKDKEIDLKKTIKKVLSKDIGINHEMSVEVEDYGWDFSELNIELFSDEFYDKLEEFKKEGKQIYIHAVYATDEIGGNSDNVYGYELNDDFDEDDYVTVGVDSCVRECDLIIDSEYYRGDMEGDYGIIIEGDEITFGQYIGGFGSSIDPVVDLSEPLNALAIEILLDIIEFKN